ncbi:MAG: hypothetical protein K2O12_06435 [Muribaculaceae bacterium]|nr:hypothetical protein [Muribaculaceae bacterium]
MNLAKILGQRLGKRDITDLCSLCSGVCNNALKADLLSLVYHTDDRISYNALWVISHFSADDMEWLYPERNALIEFVLSAVHVGKKRLALTLLERQAISKEDVRTDYLDFCLSKINSNEPYSIRVLCLKQSFALCKFYPELMVELESEIDLMQYGEMSSGLLSARKSILQKIAKLRL